MRYATLLAVAVTLTLTACASTRGVDRLAFGEYLRAGYELSERELRALQYYVSDDIHLRRAVNRATARWAAAFWSNAMLAWSMRS